MKTILEKITYLKSKIFLGSERKHEIKSRLIERLGVDVRGEQGIRQQVRKSMLAPVLTLFHIKPMPITALVGIVLAITAGVSVASENSLPGDLLYPVKVSINEEVRAAFTFGTANDARWETRRAERRLEEAAEIAVKSDVDAEVRSELEADFKETSGRVQDYIEELRASGNAKVAAEIAAELSAMLKAHNAALVEIESENEVQKINVDTLRQEVEEELEETDELEAFLEIELDIESADEDVDEDDEQEDEPSPSVSPKVSPRPTVTPKPALRLDGSVEWDR